MKKFYLVSLFLFVCHIILASNNSPLKNDEKNNQVTFQLNTQKTTETIVIDGLLQEKVWQTAEKATNFWKKWPENGEHVDQTFQTEAQITYDNHFLYVAFTCFGSNNYTIQTLKRDAGYWDGDGIAVLLDPVNQRTNGFIFGTSPLGVKMDGLVSMNGGDRVNQDWDNKWLVETKNYPDKWTVEMAIPFKTLRFEDNKTEWGLNFIRNEKQQNFFHTWTEMPLQMAGVDLGYTGLLKWDAPPKRAKGNIAVIPYTAGGIVHNIEDNENPDFDINAGFDAKIAVTSSLNLDVTFNPDFSQIEVDRQVTNLSRFSLFFPERRTFFLENSDIFNGFGIPPMRPFFSRRIGLNENGETIPIIAGMRLSGNLSKRSRIGAMSMQTKSDGETLGQNYSALAFHQSIFKRSVIKGILVSRQAFADGEALKTDYARNGGIEFNYTSSDGNFQAWSTYHDSWTPDIKDKKNVYSGGFFIGSRNFEMLHDFFRAGENYTADIGFTPRLFNYDAERDTTIRMGYSQIFSELTGRILPKAEKINNHRLQLENFIAWNLDGSLSERSTELNYNLNFSNTAGISAGLENNDINLPYPINFTDGEPLPAERYRFSNFRIGGETDERKAFSAEATFRYGSFFNGTLTSYELGLVYRRQPWGNFGLNFNLNDLDMPTPYTSEKLLLIAPRTEINFSKRLYWTTFLQYNTQSDNFNVNSRLQWRFKPLSDLFIVYTDNYITNNPWEATNRALVFKLNYWFTF